MNTCKTCKFWAGGVCKHLRMDNELVRIRWELEMGKSPPDSFITLPPTEDSGDQMLITKGDFGCVNWEGI